MLKNIRYWSVSDIHWFNSSVDGKSILASMDRLFNDYKDPEGLDIVFIPGDVFDDRTSLNHPDFTHFAIWVSRLFLFCNQYGIILRVMEGTPSHDYRQSSVMVDMYDLLRDNAISKGKTFDLDFKYISEIQIEYMPSLDINVLYVPDEALPTTSAIRERVNLLLLENSLHKVDISMMHGFFDYQVPHDKMIDRKHDSQYYLDITKHYVNSGHVHTFSWYDRILSNGSPERLTHGQEEDKGMVECLVSPTMGDSWRFIVNTGAAIFKSYYLTDMTMDEAVEYLDDRVKDLPSGSSISVRGTKSDPAIVNFDELRRKYVGYKLSKKVISTEEEIEHEYDLFSDAFVDYTPIILSKETIVETLLKEMAERYGDNLYESAEEEVMLKGILEDSL